MARRLAVGFTLLAAVLAVPLVARAKVKTDVHGSYRLVLWNQGDVALGLRNGGEPVETLGQTGFVEHRLRVGTSTTWSDFEFDFELDALNGLLGAGRAGQVIAPYEVPPGSAPRPEMADPLRNRASGLSLDSLALRKAMLTWKSNIGNFAFGASSFNWAQGMLANDGAGELDDTLGDRRFGDRVVRAMYATKPLYYLSGGAIEEDLTSVVAVDYLLQDETGVAVNPGSAWSDPARGLLRDSGLGLILALKHQRGPYSSGLFASRRTLTFEPAATLDPIVTQPFETRLAVWAVDLSFDYKRRLGAGPEAFAAFEGAFAFGETNLVRNGACPGNTDDDLCRVRQAGFVARLGVRGEKFSADLLGGYASGDGNPFDAEVTNFRFDRDYKVGLILFDQVLAWQSAGMVRRATDATITNVPAAGVDLLSTSGSITNAVFAQPTVRYRVAPHTTLTGSALWAMAPAGYMDAFWLNRTSEKTNHFGQEAGSTYGFELDFGADYRRELRDGLKLLAGLQAGYFLPGDAFVVDAEGTRMAPVHMLKVRTGILF